MSLKDKIVAQIDASEAWAQLFEGWKPGVNVTCVVAAENHESSEDAHPSMSLSEDGKAYCHSCGYKATTVVGVLADLKGIDFKEALKEAYSLFVGPLVPEEYVKACHKKLMSDEYMLAVLEERRGILKATVEKFELGWDAQKKRLVIPVRNEHGWCVNTRMHDTLGVHGPDMKMISYAKGYGAAVLWPEWQLQSDKPVYLFEGEMDALLAHSQGLPSLSVTGGASTWRESWTKRLAGRTIYIIPDVDKAGLTGAAKKMASLAVKCKASIIKLPGLKGDKKDKDFGNWVANHEGNGFKLQEIAQETETSEPIKEEIEKEADEGLEIFQELSAKEAIDIKRSQAVWRWLRARGAFFKSQNAGELYYAKEGGVAYHVNERADQFIAMLGSQVSWAINTATASGKFIVKHIVHRGTSEAKESLTGSWCLYDEAGDIYLHCGADKLLMASGGELSVVKNALNDRGVLLECPQQVKTVEPLLDTSPENAVKEAWDKCFNLLPISQTDKYLVMCWWMGMFVKEYVRPKPLLRFMARTAYGKSTATKMLSLLTYGDEVLQNSATTPAALYSIGKQFPLLFSDNVETRNMTPAFEDFMLTAATGGGKSKRQMNTDQGVVWENTNCLVCTNGIEPVNKREIVSRTAEVNLDLERYGRKDFHETKVFDEIKEARSRIICGMLKLLTRDSVPRMRTGEVQRIAKELGVHAKNRFDEYLGVMATNLDAIWPTVGDNEYERSNDVVNAWLSSQSKSTEEQDEGTNEVLYFIQELADRGASVADIRSRPEVQKDGSLRIAATMRELFTDFRVLARALNGRCPWQNERQLGTRVLDAFLVLKKAGWDHKIRIVNGRRINDFTKQGSKAVALRAVGESSMPRQGVPKLDLHPTKGQAKIDALRRLQQKHKAGKPGKAGKRVAKEG